MMQSPNRRGRKLMAEINVVPYIDVMLVLLIIFMITAPLLTQGIKVDLPKAGAEPIPSEDTQPLILSVDKQGNLYLNLGKDEEKPVTEEGVLERVGAVLRREPKTPVLVKADQNVPYGRVVAGMVLLQQAGYRMLAASNLSDGLILLKTTRPKVVVLGPELRAGTTATALEFNRIANQAAVVELAPGFSSRDAADAAGQLLESIRALVPIG